MLDPIFEDLPEDAELAFLQLEQKFRDECDRKAHNWDPQEFPLEVYLEYMRRTLAAVEELQIGILANWEIPSAQNFNIKVYRDFRGEIDHYRTALQIRHSRRNKGYSVRFDSKTKRIISHHLTQIREVFIALEIDDWKREALLSRLDDLQHEVDKDRSRYEVFGAFVIETFGIVGIAAEKMEPARRLIDSIAGLIWGAKHAEQTKQLPPPTERKPLPPPRTAPKTTKPTLVERNDEIPF